VGMRIAGAGPTLNTIRPAGTPERPQLVNPEVRLFGANRDEQGQSAPFNRPQVDVPRAGFGDGTVSVPAAAFGTLRNGLRQARSIVPSREEVRERIRDRVQEDRERRAERIEARREREEQARRIERRIPEPSAQARNFVNTLDRTAATAEARLRGEEPPARDENRPRLDINGQTFEFTRPPADNTPRFDVTV